MFKSFTVLVLLVAVFSACPNAAEASKRTVCTITVNSPDEKEAFRRFLPRDQYQFVELVQRGEPDWLAAACRRQVSCDILIVSGHFNGHDFFSDKLESAEYLPVEAMERASCSNRCPALFSHLKEVYLFGCTSLSPEPAHHPSGETLRALIRSGHPPAEAQRLADDLALRSRDSNRDIMRRIFPGVPAVYGFSSVAPLGPAAASILAGYFNRAGQGEVGSGVPNRALLAQFAAHNLAVTSGLSTGDPQMSYRSQVCEFLDDHTNPADKLEFIHRLLQGETAQARIFFDRIESFLASLPPEAWQQPAFAQALDALVHDQAARGQYLAFARDADLPATRARMLDVAHRLHWLDDSQLATERVALLRDLLAKHSLSETDVDVACKVSHDGTLNDDLSTLQKATPTDSGYDHAAVFACLGDAAARDRMIDALLAPAESDARIAQVYFERRPITSVGELRQLVEHLAQVGDDAAQARAIDTIAHPGVSDRTALATLADLFARTRSPTVQRAIAGVFLRSDGETLVSLDVAQVLRRSRVRSVESGEVIDAVLRRLGHATLAANGPAPD